MRDPNPFDFYEALDHRERACVLLNTLAQEFRRAIETLPTEAQMAGIALATACLKVAAKAMDRPVSREAARDQAAQDRVTKALLEPKP